MTLQECIQLEEELARKQKLFDLALKGELTKLEMALNGFENIDLFTNAVKEMKKQAELKIVKEFQILKNRNLPQVTFTNNGVK